MKIAFVSFYHPDESMAGAVRLHRMISFFVQKSWAVRVVTSDLFDQPPKGKLTKWFRFFKIFFKLVRDSIRIRDKTDIYFVTAPPVSMIFVGALIRLLTRRPVVFEERDLLTINPLLKFKRLRGNSVMQACERWLLSNSKSVVLATNGIRQELKKKWPEILTQKPSVVIWNGFWMPDFDAIEPKAVGQKGDIIRIAHIGNFYGSRNPMCLLEGLQEAQDLMGDLENYFHFDFVGQFENAAQQKRFYDRASDLKLDKLFTFHGLIDRKSALKILAESDIGLLITHTEGSESTVPAKIYEYLALRKKILALTHDPIVKGIVLDNQLGWCVPHDDKTGFAHVLRNLPGANLGSTEQDGKQIEKFDATYQLERLEEHLRMLTP